MDITLSQEQEVLFRTAAAFARGALSAERIREEETSAAGYVPEVWARMAEMGWVGAVLDPRWGGGGLDVLDLALLVEACGQGALPSPLFATVVEAGMLLGEVGDVHAGQWLPRVATGSAILTTAIAERGGGITPDAMATRIDRSSAGLTVSGTKLLVRHASVADAIVVLGRSGAEAQATTLVLVPRGAPGVEVERMEAAGGEPLHAVTFHDVVVPADATVGPPGQAWPLVERLLLRGACLKAAELVGIGQAALDLTLTYAKTRVQFDRPIGSFQGVQHHCAEMSRDLTACRLLTYAAARRLGAGARCAREVSMAKAKASEAVPEITRLAHQIHGAIAYYREYPLELYYNRAVAAQAAYGNASFHRRRLAALLREDLDYFRGDNPHGLPVHYR